MYIPAWVVEIEIVIEIERILKSISILGRSGPCPRFAGMACSYKAMLPTKFSDFDFERFPCQILR